MSIQVRHMFITADWVAWTIRRFGKIWQYAKDNGYAIVSKDSDFQERSVLRGHLPKIIWLRATNYTSAEIEGLLRRQSRSSLGSSRRTESPAWSWGLESKPGSSSIPRTFPSQGPARISCAATKRASNASSIAL